MLQKLIKTGDSSLGLILRLSLGFVMFMHGLQQTLGIYGDPGFFGKIKYYHVDKGVPVVLAVFGIMIVSVGAFLLIIGFWGRIMAFLNGSFLLVALFLGGHIQNGFFMNWETTRPGEGFEYHILGIGIAIAIMIYGSGLFSVDRLMMKKN